MQIIYIKESDKQSIIDTILYKIKVVTKDNKKFFLVPINKKTKNKKIRKISKKINKLLHLENSNTVVLSDFLLKKDLLKNELYSNNIHILDGRKLFRVLEYNILEKIFEYKKTSIKNRRNSNAYK